VCAYHGFVVQEMPVCHHPVWIWVGILSEWFAFIVYGCVRSVVKVFMFVVTLLCT